MKKLTVNAFRVAAAFAPEKNTGAYARAHEILSMSVWKKGSTFVPDRCGKPQNWGRETLSFGRALEWHSRGQRFDPAFRGYVAQFQIRIYTYLVP